MIAVTGVIDTIEAVHDAVRRMEEGAARHYEQLALAAEAMTAPEAATTLRSLAAAARRRAKTFSGSTLPASAPPQLTTPFSPDGLALESWQVLELALDMEYSMLNMLEMLQAIGETEEIRAEAGILAERKRLHLGELDQRQDHQPSPADGQD
ncbi:hypothetical protein [Magnetospirillum sulfuroxidans]|uniref:Ferritin-like metal-binding protein YciE n=1 Tax=Magnetospirillum sulfuroxidans TaxID=611300 RepID=A0ABS5IB67_9PROT|nr:hypothetical protein [Magnetospirillum sulfuroxidans]MBR9971669.1 hypothetical protein [Magnetospirillum sulfuroxidans]